MPGIYVDTSALGRVALGEPDAVAIRKTLARFDPWYASELLDGVGLEPFSEYAARWRD